MKTVAAACSQNFHFLLLEGSKAYKTNRTGDLTSRLQTITIQSDITISFKNRRHSHLTASFKWQTFYDKISKVTRNCKMYHKNLTTEKSHDITHLFFVLSTYILTFMPQGIHRLKCPKTYFPFNLNDKFILLVTLIRGISN